MNGWLVDTNVVSELRKRSCDSNVQAWSEAQPATSLYLGTVTLAEIRYGIERHSEIAFRATLTAWLDGTLRPWFAGRILEIDEDVILEWRRLIDHGGEQGITFSHPDLFIAAIAKLNDLTVVTRNVADFDRARVRVRYPGLPVVAPVPADEVGTDAAFLPFLRPGYVAVSRSISPSSIVLRATSRSYILCRLSQNSGVIPRA